MTERDLIDHLLAGQRVPAMSGDFADRVVSEATRVGRRASPPLRRRARRWTRRGTWTAVIALNLVLASAVAAAIGGARIVPESVVAATHRVLERIRPHVPQLSAPPRPAPVIRHHAAMPARTVPPPWQFRPLPPRSRAEPQFAPRPLARLHPPRPAHAVVRHRPAHDRAPRHWRERPSARPQRLGQPARRLTVLPPRWQQPRGWRRPPWYEARPQRWRPRAWRGGGPRLGRGPRRRR